MAVRDKGLKGMIKSFVKPFALTSYYPASWLLQKQDQQIGLFTPLAGIALLGIAYVFWR